MDPGRPRNVYDRFCDTRPGKRLQQTNWKDPPLLMGQSTISVVMFNSYVKLPEGSKLKLQS